MRPVRFMPASVVPPLACLLCCSLVVIFRSHFGGNLSPRPLLENPPEIYGTPAYEKKKKTTAVRGAVCGISCPPIYVNTDFGSGYIRAPDPVLHVPPLSPYKDNQNCCSLYHRIIP